MRIRILAISAFIAAAGCATLKTYEMLKVQEQLSQAFMKSEELTDKIKADYIEKQSLIATLKKTKSQQMGEIEGQIQEHLNAMDTALNDVSLQKRLMSEANSQVIALAYRRQNVHSHEPEFERIDEAVRKFESSAKILNESAVDYSSSSNALAKLIADRKLFFNFDVAEFQTKISEQIRSAQAFQAQMKTQIERGQAVVLNWPKVKGRIEAEKILERMVATAKEFSAKAQKLSSISRDTHRLTLGYARISTTDRLWPDLQKLVQDYERTAQTLTEQQSDFTKLNQSFRQSAQGTD